MTPASDTEVVGAIIGALVALVTAIIWLAKRSATASEQRDKQAAAAAERRELAQEGIMNRFAGALEKFGDGQQALAAAVDRLNDRVNDELTEVRAEVRGMRKDLDEITPPARPVGLYSGARGPKKEGG